MDKKGRSSLETVSGLAMEILRDIREVAELWLCERFVPAFHFVFGWPNITKPKFDAIRRAGALLPAGEIGRSGLFVLDVLAGDDRYNFLAAVGRPMGIGQPICYGFVFDAEQLIAEGAYLGAGDLLLEYARAAKKIAEADGFDPDQINALGRTKFSPEAMRRFVEYHSGRSWGESERKPLADLIPVMVAAFHEIQSQNRFAGRRALTELHTWARPVCNKMNAVIDLAPTLLHSEEFHEEFVRRYDDDFFKWGKGLACKVALRDIFYRQQGTVVPWELRGPPEILWRGRLPLNKAVAAFDIGCRLDDSGVRGGLDWPDDIFSLFCPRA